METGAAAVKGRRSGTAIAILRAMPEPITIPALLDRYDVFLVDAYGVLVTTSGPLPGAAELLERIDGAGKRWLLLSNDASRLPETTVRRYRGFGLPVDAARVLTSGELLADHFRRHGLVGAPTVVLGPEDSRRMVVAAGGVPVSAVDPAAAVIVVADDEGYPFRPTIEHALTTAVHRVERGEPLHLVLPNPDLIYPKSERAFGVTAGAAALLIEEGLRVRFPRRAPRFHRLGKPHAPIFEAAFARLGGPPPDRVVMIGDQLATDIRGAADFGIDSVLVGTGLTALDEVGPDDPARPTWVVATLLDGRGPQRT